MTLDTHELLYIGCLKKPVCRQLGGLFKAADAGAVQDATMIIYRIVPGAISPDCWAVERKILGDRPKLIGSFDTEEEAGVRTGLTRPRACNPGTVAQAVAEVQAA